MRDWKIAEKKRRTKNAKKASYLKLGFYIARAYTCTIDVGL